MLDVTVAVIGWVLIGWLPGFVLLSVLRPSSPLLENAAIGSLASLGVLMFVSEGLFLLHLPIRPWTVLPISLVACGLPSVLATPRLRLSARVNRLSRIDAAAVVVAVLLGVAIWCLIIRSPTAVLPGTDGAHHGLYAARIERYGTLDPARILAGDPTSSSPTSSYYPLALHLAAALIAGATGIPVSAALTVALVLSAAVLLPVGMYLLVGWLCSLPRAGSIAALLSAVVPWFPYEPVVWGGLPTIVGISQVPALVRALVRTERMHSVGREALAIALCCYGLFAEHNSELVTAALIAFALLVPLLPRVAATQRARRLAAYLAAIGILLLALTPQALALARNAAGSADQFKLHGTLAPTQHVVPLVMSHGMAVTLGLSLLPLALVAVGTSHRHTWTAGWGWASLALVLIFCLSFSTNPLATVITAPWYATPLRATYQLMPVLVAYAAGGLAGLLKDVRSASVKGRKRIATVGGVIVLGAGVILALTALPSTVSVGARGYRDSSLVGPDQLAGFAWLGNHVPPGARVLNDFNDGSGWMEVLADVHPVFGARVDPTSLAGWGDRGYLLTHASALANDSRAQAAVRHWNVQYVYFNAKYFDGNPELLTIDDLRGSAAYHLVWHRGDVSIFKIELAKTA